MDSRPGTSLVMADSLTSSQTCEIEKKKKDDDDEDDDVEGRT